MKGLSLLVGAALLAYIGLNARNGVPGVSYYTVRAEFDDLNNLDRNADVRIAGRRVGQALDIRRENGKAVVDLQLDDAIGPLPADTTVRVRSVSLLGAQYLDVSPGRSAAALEEDATIPSASTSASVELPEFLAAFDRRTREGLGTTVRELGRGYLGRGLELNAALRDAPPYLRDLQLLADAVNARGGAARRFFPSLESAAAAADPVREEIARGFEPQARALAPFAERRGALHELLEQAPVDLPAIRTGLAHTDPMLAEARGFLRASTQIMRPARRAFRQASALLDEAQGPLRLTRPLLTRAAGAVPDVLAFTDRVSPEISDLRRMLRDSLPGLRELAVRRCDFVGWARNWRSFLRYGVPGGKDDIGPLNMLRFESILHGETVAGGGDSVPNDPVASDPYPAPCKAGTKGRP